MRQKLGYSVLLLMLLPTCTKPCDEGWEFDEERQTCVTLDCEDNLQVTGALRMGISTTMSIDETVSTGLSVVTEHKMDVDLYEAGCISNIEVQIDQGGLGCRLDMDFNWDGPDSFELSALNFNADSYCPDFPDHIEGEYRATGPISLTVRGLPSQVSMETGTEEAVCVDDINLNFEATGTLYLSGSDIEHPFSLNLNLSGDLWSFGSTTADC